MANRGRRLIVGVDYGTTFSGVSYVFSDKTSVDDIEVLNQWGSRSNQNKVPSRIAYHPTLNWGYDVEPGQVAYCWTKLLLDQNAPITYHDDEKIRKAYGSGYKATPHGKSAEDVVADYLTLLYRHVMGELGRKISTQILHVTPISFWFTHPALWSLRAQTSTMNAARRAGFGSRPRDEINLIKEPEAAAIFSLSYEVSHGQSDLIHVGRAVLICDCGGGTVDLASYKITRDFPRLELDQACVSEGGKCGSTAIDRAFTELMETWFGPAFTNLPPQKRDVNSKFMEDFELVKRGFNGSSLFKKHLLSLKMPLRPFGHYDDEDNVVLGSWELKALFDPVVEKVMLLIEEQVRATEQEGLLVETIMLVGGFGSSPYLYKRVDNMWRRKGVNVLNPPKSWEAVCLGAALRGLNGAIVNKKKSRSHLGHILSMDFREGVDDEEEAVYCPWDGLKKASNRMHWFIQKGEEITPATTKYLDFYHNHYEGDTEIWDYPLYESRSSIAPDTVDSYSVIKVGTIEVDFTSADFDLFQYTWLADGSLLYKIDYTMVVIPEDDLGWMQLRIECQGQPVGEARLKFDGE